MLIRHVSERGMMLPVTRGELMAARALIGLFVVPPNRKGVRKWRLMGSWRDRCLAAGLDPVSMEVVDSERFLAAIARIEQRKKKHVAKAKPMDLGNRFRRRILSED